MSIDIKALAREKKFGEMETAVYADRSLVGQLVELLGEKDGDVRTGVLNVLSRVGFDYPKDTRPYIDRLIALMDEADPFLKIDAANAVGNLAYRYEDASSRAVPKLKLLLDHEVSLVRQEAAYALGNIGFSFIGLVKDLAPRLVAQLLIYNLLLILFFSHNVIVLDYLDLKLLAPESIC